jgi:hypothetical protein
MEITHWLNDIDQLTSEYTRLVENLSKEDLNQKVSPQDWSAAQILDHIMIINKSYFEIPEIIQSGSYRMPFLGRINFIVNFFGQLILKSVHPEEQKRARTFPIWEPSKSDLPLSIIDEFVSSQNDLKTWISSNKTLIDQNPVVSSPANHNIVYRFKTLIEIMITHEKRHLVQLIEWKDQIVSTYG